MRFHVGFSFRLKTLKKFLFPILIGLLSYFGLSFLNLGVVFASTNYNTYYNLSYDNELNFDDIFWGDYTYHDILDIALQDSQYYNVLVYIRNYHNNTLCTNHSNNVCTEVGYILFDKNDTYYNIDVRGYKSSANVYNFQQKIWTQNESSTYIARWLINNSTSTSQSQFDLYFTNGIYQALNTGVISNSQTSNIILYGYYGAITNTNSYTYNLTQLPTSNSSTYILYSSIPSKIIRKDTSSTSYFYKTIRFGSTDIGLGDYYPPYCDFYSCIVQSQSFSSFLEKQPYIYANIDIDDLSSFDITYEYYVNSIDVNDYLDNLVQNKFYYGRINHNNNYYSYEQLNCSSSSTGSTFNNKISTTINNFSCTNDLTAYDKFFISVYPRYDDEALNYSIYDFSLSSSGFSTFSVKSYNYFVDNFENLSSGFKLLVSSKDTLNNDDIYIWSNNLYVAVDYLPNIDSSIDTLTNGSWLQSVLYPIRFNFGQTTNNMLLVYDDISYSQVQSSDLLFYLKTSMIISFESADTFYYYDNNNDIVSNEITLTYDAIISENNYSSIEQYFIQVDNFINSINNDLYTYHTLLDNIYNIIPIFFQQVLQVLYILLLSFLLFKALRK